MKTITQLAMAPDATEGMIYCAVGQNGWGKNPNAVKALRTARRNGSKGKYSVHLVNADCSIDQIDGTLYYDSKREGIKIQLATITVR